MAQALTHISDGMGLRAVAEGVETAKQAETLYLLGYRYAQPMPSEQITLRQSDPELQAARS